MFFCEPVKVLVQFHLVFSHFTFSYEMKSLKKNKFE